VSNLRENLALDFGDVFNSFKNLQAFSDFTGTFSQETDNVNLLINPKSIVIKAITPSGKIVADIIGITKKVNRIQVGRIFSLCVLKEYCKKGIATHLLKLLEEEFYLNSIRKVVLEVSALNVIAQQFYQRHGYFITSSILPNFYNDGSDAFVMNKNLL